MFGSPRYQITILNAAARERAAALRQSLGLASTSRKLNIGRILLAGEGFGATLRVFRLFVSGLGAAIRRIAEPSAFDLSPRFGQAMFEDSSIFDRPPQTAVQPRLRQRMQ